MDYEFLSPIDLARLVGGRARARRMALGKRQADLAVAAGVPVSTLRRFEAGRKVGLDVLLRIAIALGAEREVRELFPEPETRSLDEILRSQKQRARARVRVRAGGSK
jgi:transcriptional regulator with XRE-family HTH domain